MLYGNKSADHAAQVNICTCVLGGWCLILSASPLMAQTGEPLTFESRFFFTERPAPIAPQESAPSGAPGNSDTVVSEGAQSSRELPDTSVRLRPQADRTSALRRTQTAHTDRMSKPVPQRTRPIASGRAAWYQHAGRTASGEKFDPELRTAAHKSLPFGTRLRVVNVQNGKSVVVRINDRVAPKAHHVTIDLSRGSARAIGITGVGRVALYRLEDSH